MKSFFAFLKELKQKKLLFAMLILGIALLIFSSFSPKEAVKKLPSSPEEKLALLLEKIDGVGEAQVFLRYDTDDCVLSAIILASGAAEEQVKADIFRAVMVALSLDAQHVAVYPLSDTGKV